MSTSIDYPPSISPKGSEYLLACIKDWSIAHGLAVRPSGAFVPDEIDRSHSLAVTAPVTLYPSLFPRTCFEEARDIQPSYNALYAAIAEDESWLGDIVKELLDVDDFIAQLWNVHQKVLEQGYVQDISLGIFRSDYMVHQGFSGSAGESQLRQIEFNTIASSFGGLSSRVSALHKYLANVSAYSDAERQIVSATALPDNDSIELIAHGLRAAHEAYGDSKAIDKLPLCIAFVVQHRENNVFDQLALSYHLHEVHKITVFRLPFSLALEQTTIAEDNPARPLIYHPPHCPSASYEVTTLYFRAAYSPSEYPSSLEWKCRFHLERSAAIKCPSILTHLAGSKKIQQILATPSSPYLDRFLKATPYEDIIDRVKATFAAIYPLDRSEAGRKAIDIARDSQKSKGFVLKPQREGGGNNVYGSKIPPYLASLGDDDAKYRSHILMEMIEPPPLRNTILRNGQVRSGEVICELGIYGTCLWQSDHGGKRTGKILKNAEAGFLLRTKSRESEEGGVAAGFGAVDSPYLTD